MNPDNLKIRGDSHSDAATLKKFSRDMSSYRILPALVVEPKDEDDLISTLRFARDEGLGIVPRSGGSDLSGASIGPGIIINFKKHFNQVVSVGEETVTKPGVVLDNLVKEVSTTPKSVPEFSFHGVSYSKQSSAVIEMSAL